MKWNRLLKCFFVSLVSSSLWPVSPLLVSFRPPSRNTQGFTAAGGNYILPALELLACLGSNCTARLEPYRGTQELFQLSGVFDPEDAVVAVERACLSHSLFELLGDGGDTVEAAAASAAAAATAASTTTTTTTTTTTSVTTAASRRCETAQTMPDAVGWLGATTFLDAHFDTQSLHPPPDELQRRARSWAIAAGGPGSAKAKLPCAAIEIFSRTEAASPAQAPSPSWHVFARRLAFGPAVDAATGSVASSTSRRRPRAGLLKTLALHSRRGLVKTSMEPELALVMANLAAVGLATGDDPGAPPQPRLVLDPFVGSASLLLAAAHLGKGSTETLGVEAAAFLQRPELVDEVREDWRRLGVSPAAVLKTGNILEWNSSGSAFAEAIGGKRFDAIVTDPPYGINAAPLKAGGGGDEAGPASRRDKQDEVQRLYDALFALAAERLKEKGRLVFFSPERMAGDAPPRSSPSFCGLSLPPSLEVLHTSRQVFRGGTFARLLVVVEKRGEGRRL